MPGAGGEVLRGVEVFAAAVEVQVLVPVATGTAVGGLLVSGVRFPGLRVIEAERLSSVVVGGLEGGVELEGAADDTTELVGGAAFVLECVLLVLAPPDCAESIAAPAAIPA